MVICYIDYLCDFPPDKSPDFIGHGVQYLFVFMIHYSIINFNPALKGP